ncbi:hypothetical protein ACFWM7_10225 [Streptomyces sp. NPDC058375]|uniref:hypothetical protein n=1 Tax=Streptomyces sp. NPDC058375 TaxID=3346467 RepID=UPI0036506D1B
MSDFNGANGPSDDTAAAVKQTAQDKAGEGVGLVSEKATDVTGTAKEHAGDVAGEAAARAQDVVGELRDQLQDQARTQTQSLAQSVRRLADELSDMGESGKENSPATNAVRQIADRGRDVAERLESGGPQGLVSDIQAFARRRPGAFLAGAALAGFVTARLGKGVKSAGEGTTSPTEVDSPAGSASGTAQRGRPGTTTDGPPDGSREPADTGVPSPTPSYGGSIAPPGPLPVTDPYPNPDPQQP